MNHLERKINLLAELALADNETQREKIKKALAEEMRRTPSGESSETLIRVAINHALQDLGIPCRLAGHAYLVTALCAVVQEPELVHHTTYELYPRVAAAHNSTASRVERAVRHSIEVCHDRADPDAIVRYFGSTVSPRKGRLTNSEFLGEVANYIRTRLDL